MSKTLKKVIIGIVLLGLIGLLAYRMFNPPGPVTDPVQNNVTDRAVKNWKALEAKVPMNPTKDVFFGDMHVHTAFSFDAYIGGTTARPVDAYQFAQGGTINVLGTPVKIERPLDFAAVTDHSEYLGELYTVNIAEAEGHNTLHPRVIRSIGVDTAKQTAFFQRMLRNTGKEKKEHPRLFRGFHTTMKAWDIAIKAAEEQYKPGTFTTFAAYEWTLGVNLAHAHRNVFFRDMVVPDYPVSAIEASNEEELWASLDNFRAGGSTVMAVPHNSNLSEGTAFPLTRVDGSPIDKEYVQLRNKNEPLVEIHQAKGNSEVFAEFWENDEFSNFENYNQGTPDINNFVRHTLKRGLEYEEKLGTNPYKYGIIGSTDTHNATPGNTEESDDYIGNHCQVDSRPETRVNRDWILEPTVKTYKAVNPGGLMAVWAAANTRSDIYDAMTQKETYATSGGRIKLRFFGGYNYDNKYSDYNQMVKDGYEKGTAMGGDLIPNKSRQAPKFIVWASKDAMSGNLERIQIIKGWYEDGQLEEKIFDAVLSNGRAIDRDIRADDLGDIVDLSTGEVSAGAGDVELSTVWTDPEFNPSHRAFYYARVLEVQTPRYSLWDEIKHGVKYPEEVPKTIKERAWSSPIWYSPIN